MVLRGSAVYEFLVRQRVVLYQGQDGVPEQERVLAVVVTPLSLVNVGVQMLDAHVVVGADHGALEQAPDALHGVRVNVAAYPFLYGVIDDLVPRVLVTDALVADPLIGVDGFGVVSNNVLKERVERVAVVALPDPEPDSTIAGDSAEDHVLADLVSAADSPALAAVPGLVSLNDPGQLVALVLHRAPDAVAEVPRRFVAADLEHPLDLVGADALLGLDHQVDGGEPLPQGELGVLKDRPGQDREALAA